MTPEQKDVLDILTNYHTDPIDAIGEPTLTENGTIEVQFQSGNKLMTATINEDQISYKITNPGDIQGDI